ncbi:hypothetical protein OWR29_44000 [Actinoplanes sp. Pm04-4]|uniref:Uncharacterized protein n=1 Tax=Paractinoplanes pyxinae TaxID=2997416 RepID=A0ABT4BHD1_9ACTN|nr:hypothetical protein [Actinoplanes pyxinae]MCY1145005.1 hypothetical protein [Actinoplanes pyxinae]
MVERKIDVLVVRWYERLPAAGIVGRWFDAAAAHLPEAVPKRFGDTEPLKGQGGRAEVEAALGRAQTLLFLAGTAPVYHASLGTDGGPRLGPVVAHSLQVELDPSDERVRKFALAVAGEDTIYVGLGGRRDDARSEDALGAGGTARGTVSGAARSVARASS